MSYLFIKNLFPREKFVLFSKQIKNLKKYKKPPKKNIFSGCFRCFFLVFLGGFFIARTLPADRPARGSDSPTTTDGNTRPAPAPGCCPPDRSDRPATSRSSRETDRSADSSPERRGLRIRIHFIRIRIQIQHFRLNTDPDPGF